jgi:hypothetical protein
MHSKETFITKYLTSQCSLPCNCAATQLFDNFLLLWNPSVCHRIHHGSPLGPLVLIAVYILHTFSFRHTLILFSHIHLLLFIVLSSSDFAVTLLVHFHCHLFLLANLLYLITFTNSSAGKICKVLQNMYFCNHVTRTYLISLLSKSLCLFNLD